MVRAELIHNPNMDEMKTIVKKQGENRRDYLLRVALAYIDEERTNVFDEAECDGYCLIEDIRIELGLDEDVI